MLDRLVEMLARVLDALGMSGTRLRWRWNQRRRTIGEGGLRASIGWRSARGKHKMCPHCRALVPRTAGRCDECGESVSGASAPGFGRLLRNLLPGATTATSLILLANGFWFVLSLMVLMQSGNDVGLGSILGFPGWFSETLVGFGMMDSYRAWALGEWWRLIPPIFLHGGLIHFFFNSYILLQIAPMVEEEYDTPRMFVAYLGSGMIGFIGTAVWWRLTASPTTVAMGDFGRSLGASGAILGLMGLLLAYAVRRGGGIGRRVKSLIGQYVVFLLLMSLLFPGVDHAAHLGGLAGGFAIGWIMPYGPYRRHRQSVTWEAAAYASLLLIVLAYYKVAVTYSAIAGG